MKHSIILLPQKGTIKQLYLHAFSSFVDDLSVLIFSLRHESMNSNVPTIKPGPSPWVACSNVSQFLPKVARSVCKVFEVHKAFGFNLKSLNIQHNKVYSTCMLQFWKLHHGHPHFHTFPGPLFFVE